MTEKFSDSIKERMMQEKNGQWVARQREFFYDRLFADRRLIKLPQVKELTSLSRAAIYRRIASGDFPKPVKLGTTSAWPTDEVAEWIARQMAARDQAA